MGILTNFLKLLKPEPNDFVDVAKHISENYDKLDENAKSNDETLTNLNNNKLDKGTYPGNASDLNTEISKIASTTQLGRIIVGDNLTIDEAGRLSGNPAVDIRGKMDKYQYGKDIRDYDDLTEDGFYILTGSEDSSPSKNAPYADHALVQVWNFGGYIYQNAVSHYNVELQFTRCFYKEVKNTKWERIVNTANYSSMCPYSIGDILLTVSNQNPAVKWVGTIWEKIEGRFLLSTSGSGGSGQLGGSNTKTIEQANLPNIKLQVDPFSLSVTPPDIQLYNNYAGNSESGRNTLSTSGDADKAGWSQNYIRVNSGGTTGIAQPYTSALGSGVPFNVSPAYYTVHIWKRIA